jgi:tetratricopeptide (TPR) repeat protein
VLDKRRKGRPKRDAPARGNALGTRIRRARQGLGLSLAAVAGSDFTRSFLNQVELGRAQPSMHSLRTIADRLQCPIEFFLQDPEVSSAALELTLTEAGTRLHQGDAARAETLIRQLLDCAIPPETRPRAQFILAGALQKRGAAAESIPVLEEAVKASERSGWTALTAELYDAMGRAHYLLRRPREAERWFQRAVEAYDSGGLKDPMLKARILGHQANLHYVAGEAGEAIAVYQAAIDAAEQVLDLPALAAIYEGLALSFQQTGQFARGLTYAQRSLRIFETLEDVRMSAELRHNMAEMLLQQGRTEEAERLYLEGAAQLERLNDRQLLPLPLAGAAEAALELGALDRAEHLAGRALDALQLSTEPLAIVATHRVAGRVMHASGRHAASRQHFETALATASTIDSPELRARVTYDYARTLEAQGDAHNAAIRFREAYESRRSTGA